MSTRPSRGPVRSALLLAALATVGLLTACSQADGSETGTTAPITESASDEPQAPDGFGGVNGEIAYVGDGLAQVQDGESQTAVTWTDETTVTQTAVGSLEDVTVGVCVSAFSSEEGDVATSITVSDPVDGECVQEFGGFGGGMPGGEAPTDRPSGTSTDLPSDMPTDMPSDFPSDMPSDMPSGDAPGGGFGGAATTGAVAAVTDSVITVTTDDGDVEIAVDEATEITVTKEADTGAIAVGLCLTATGDDDDSGTVAATTIALSDAGDEGCRTGGGMGGGGAPPGADGGPDQGADEPATDG